MKILTKYIGKDLQHAGIRWVKAWEIFGWLLVLSGWRVWLYKSKEKMQEDWKVACVLYRGRKLKSEL